MTQQTIKGFFGPPKGQPTPETAETIDTHKDAMDDMQDVEENEAVSRCGLLRAFVEPVSESGHEESASEFGRRCRELWQAAKHLVRCECGAEMETKGGNGKANRVGVMEISVKCKAGKGCSSTRLFERIQALSDSNDEIIPFLKRE
ncbi:hypothetical protein HDU98_003199, partial [Podochytrium sp. JEL0797]